MFNYLSAEWYKFCRRKGVFIAFGLFLMLILLLFVPAFWYGKPVVGVYAAAYLAFLPMGFFLAPVFAVRAFDDQYGRRTLKNEAVFGIPRYRSYLGKLCLGALVGTGAALMVLGLYVFLCVAYGSAQGGSGAVWICVELCIEGTLRALPLWLASLSLAFCLQVFLKNGAGAMLTDYLVLVVGTPLSLMVFGEDTHSPLLNFFGRWFFVAPIRSIYTAIDQEWTTLPNLSNCWLLGLGWAAVTTLAGLVILRRRELD